MNPNVTNPRHQPETEFHGELHEFSGAALAPDDPSIEPRERKGRPMNGAEPPTPDTHDGPAQH